MLSIKNEMDNKSHEFLQFQKKYYTHQADDTALMEHTTQPFWQSMRLSKRRLTEKGLSMDVEISRDAKSQTIREEGVSLRKDGHHLVGNKTLNVLIKRRFYRNGKKIATMKNRELCKFALLKTEVNGDRAACPNCGYVNTITSFIDGCDACNSKFRVQDFETKVSAFSFEENTPAKIRDTVLGNAKLLGGLIAGLILLAIIVLIPIAKRLTYGVTGINVVNPMIGFYLAVIMISVIFKILVVLLVIFVVGTAYLISRYKRTILQEEVIKQYLPEFSVRDFYQNLEYKLRNIHLTDKVDEVSVFARCSLEDTVKNYQNVVECDMTRLKFLQCNADSDGYRVKVQAELRLTECKRRRISTKYEKVILTLFGKQSVIDKSVAALWEYKCPGCGGSVNVLEGGKCSYCGNVFDYSEFGWVMEAYQGIRRKVSLYQLIKYTMLGICVIVFGFNLLCPMGLGKGNIFQIHNSFTQQALQLEKIFAGVEYPHELYEGVTLLSDEDYMIERRLEYEALDTDMVMEQYRHYLEEQGFVVLQETENSFSMYQTFEVVAIEEQEIGYYRMTVTREGSSIIIAGYLGSDLEVTE